MAVPVSSQSRPEPSSGSSSAAPFPDAPRVIYDRNPLAEVICQVRFPPILRIEAQLPDAFQERVRNLFPVYQDNSRAGLAGIELPEEMMQFVRANMPAAFQKPGRAFSSEDGTWTITLSATDLLGNKASATTKATILSAPPRRHHKKSA